MLKEAADEELVEAVRRAAVGESYLNPRLGARIASEPPPGPPDDLSDREVDVLRLIALGHTNAEIAEQLYLSVRTVETHRSHIQQKLGSPPAPSSSATRWSAGLISTGTEPRTLILRGARNRRCSHSCSASTPGNERPSRSSSVAPPPVERWEICRSRP